MSSEIVLTFRSAHVEDRIVKREFPISNLPNAKTFSCWDVETRNLDDESEGCWHRLAVVYTPEAAVKVIEQRQAVRPKRN